MNRAGRRTLALAAVALVVAAAVALLVLRGGGDRAPSLSDVRWRGDFDTGDLTQWREAQSACSSASLGPSDVGDSCIRVVRSPRRQGGYAAQFAVGPRTADTGEVARAEVYATRAETASFEGREWTYGWATRFPARRNGGWWTRGGDWNFFSQFHNTRSECGSALAFGVDASSGGPRLFLELLRPSRSCGRTLAVRKLDLGELRFDHWYDFRLVVRWSRDPRRGHIAAWVDGRRVAAAAWPTLADPEGVYWKLGFYRGATNGSNVVLHDGAVRAAVEG